MTQHKEIKPINFNFIIFKGEMTFKQFLITILVLAITIISVSIVISSSLNINNKYLNYHKKAVEIQTNDIKVK